MVFWILGSTNDELLTLVNSKITECYKDIPDCFYEVRNENIIKNAVRLFTVVWKEKGQALMVGNN